MGAVGPGSLAERFHRAVHKVCVAAAVNVQVNKARQNVAVFRVYSFRIGGTGHVDANDLSFLHQNGAAFRDPVLQNHIAVADPKFGHKVSSLL